MNEQETKNEPILEWIAFAPIPQVIVIFIILFVGGAFIWSKLNG